MFFAYPFGHLPSFGKLFDCWLISLKVFQLNGQVIMSQHLQVCDWFKFLLCILLGGWLISGVLINFGKHGDGKFGMVGCRFVPTTMMRGRTLWDRNRWRRCSGACWRWLTNLPPYWLQHQEPVRDRWGKSWAYWSCVRELVLFVVAGQVIIGDAGEFVDTDVGGVDG